MQVRHSRGRDVDGPHAALFRLECFLGRSHQLRVAKKVERRHGYSLTRCKGCMKHDIYTYTSAASGVRVVIVVRGGDHTFAQTRRAYVRQQNVAPARAG